MFVVDTNLLIYAAATSFGEHKKSRSLLLEWRAQSSAWFTAWGILYEFLRVVTHPKVLAKPLTVAEAWSFVRALLASPGLSVLVEGARHAEVAEQVLKEVPRLEGNLAHGAHTAILMREHGVRRIYTRDTDFHRFPFLEVIDPLA